MRAVGFPQDREHPVPRHHDGQAEGAHEVDERIALATVDSGGGSFRHDAMVADRRRRWVHWAPVALVVAVLVIANAVTNQVLPERLYVPWSLAVAALLIVIAVRLDGRAATELGLSQAKLARGLRVGAVVVAAVAAVYAVGLAIPETRQLFEDKRVAGQGLAESLYDALVRVPLGTVALEEVAFRGVLPAVLAVRIGLGRAVAISAGLFGLWHVLPSLGLGDVNPVAAEAIGQASVVVPVSMAVLSTAVGGVMFWWLRHRSGSLLAPALAHWATNGMGYLLAFAVTSS